MKRPVPYYVNYESTTPDEPRHGWYWIHEDEDGETVFHGPFIFSGYAEESINEYMDNKDND